MPTWVDRLRLQFEDGASAKYKAAGKSVETTNAEMKKSAFSLQTAIKAVMGAWATQKAISFVGQGITEAIEAERASLRLGATLRATGKDAQLSADGVNALAQSLADKSTFDDDAIAGAQALLLEFDNISAKALPRATRAILDLAARTGDLNGATMMIGKALQGEEGSLMALGKAGIKFNDELQKNIDSLRAHGRAAEADDIILTKLEGRIGGVDAALAAGGNGLIQNSKRWIQLKEDIGTAIIESEAFMRTMKTMEILLGKTRAIRPIELMNEAQVKTTIGLINEAVEAKNKLDRPAPTDSPVENFKAWEDASTALRQYVGDFKTLEEVKTRLKAREIEIPKQAAAAAQAEIDAKADAAKEARFKAEQEAAKTRKDAELAALKKAEEERGAYVELLEGMREEDLKSSHEGRLALLEEQYKQQLALAEKYGGGEAEIEANYLRIREEENQAYFDSQQQLRDKEKAAGEQAARDAALVVQTQTDAITQGAQLFIEASRVMAGSGKKNAKEMKSLALFEVVVNGARAVMQALGSYKPPLSYVFAGLSAGMAAVQFAKVASAKFATGGFPTGRGAMIQVNEQGQEAVLNARATSRLGIAGVTAMNSGAPWPGRTTNEVNYSPTYHISGGAAPDILEALEQDKTRFASFLGRLQRRGYFGSTRTAFA